MSDHQHGNTPHPRVPDFFAPSATANSYMLLRHVQTGSIWAVRFTGENTFTGALQVDEVLPVNALPVLEYGTDMIAWVAAEEKTSHWCSISDIVTPEAWG